VLAALRIIKASVNGRQQWASTVLVALRFRWIEGGVAARWNRAIHSTGSATAGYYSARNSFNSGYFSFEFEGSFVTSGNALTL
jgi:hypothetical protein